MIVLSQLEALLGISVDSDLYVTDVGAIVVDLGDAPGLTTLMVLTGLFEHLPTAVLAGIVIVAGISLCALDDFTALWRPRRSEFWLGTATITSALALGAVLLEFDARRRRHQAPTRFVRATGERDGVRRRRHVSTTPSTSI